MKYRTIEQALNQRRYWSTRDIERHNDSCGWIFFSPDTMQGWRSRILSDVYGSDGSIFVTSEKSSHNARRLYTVRQINRNTGRINTLSRFQQFGDARAAKRWASTYTPPHDEPDGTDDQYSIESRYGLNQGQDWLQVRIRRAKPYYEQQADLCNLITQDQFYDLLRDWINQSSDLTKKDPDWRSVESDKQHALAELDLFLTRPWNPAVMADSLQRAYSGRLNLKEDKDGQIYVYYVTGQYWPTEYRAAARWVINRYNNATEPPYSGEVIARPDWDSMRESWDIFEGTPADLPAVPFWVTGRDIYSDHEGNPRLVAVPAASHAEAKRIKYWIDRRHETTRNTISEEVPDYPRVTVFLSWRYHALGIES